MELSTATIPTAAVRRCGGDEHVRERVDDADARRASEAARAAARSDVDVASAATMPMDTAAVRAATTAQDALSSAPASIPTKNNPKPSAAKTARPAPAATRARPVAAGSFESVAMPADDESDPEPLQRRRGRLRGRRRRRAGRRRRRRDRRDDPHRADCEAAIEGRDADQDCDSRTGGGQELDDSRERLVRDRTPRGGAPPGRPPVRRRARRGRPGAARRALRRSRRRPSTRAPPSASSAATCDQSLPTGRVAACASSWFAW